MKNAPLTTADTLSPQRAVQEYLDTLLQDATTVVAETAVVEVNVAEENIVETSAVEVNVTETAAAVEVQQPTLVEPRIAETRDLEPATTPLTETDIHQALSEEPQADPWINGRPPWAQQGFDCLLFKVAGLTLAVPLAELGGVLALEAELTPLFGQPDWFLGLLPSKTVGTVKVIDTARWVMPEKYTEQSAENLRYVIRIEGSDWGMACHDVADAISLQPDQVRWRSDRGRRPWLAGTVVEHMCAIMDVKSLVDLVREDQQQVAGPHN